MLACLFLSSFTVNASPVLDPARMTKADFAAYCDELYQNSQSISIRSVLSAEDIDWLMAQYTIGAPLDPENPAAGTGRELYENQLNQAGIYFYRPIEEPSVQPLSDRNGVKMNNAIVAYNSTDGTWMVSGGGYWLNYYYYMDDLPGWAWYPSVGDRKDVGGYDAVGVSVINQSGSVPGLVRSYAYVRDDTDYDEYHYNPTNGNHRDGVIFEYQDYEKCLTSGLNGYTSSYVGHGFSAMAVYDSSFKNWNGQAKTIYTHTWSKGQIEGISVGNGGFTVSLSNANQGWTITSNSTVSF